VLLPCPHDLNITEHSSIIYTSLGRMATKYTHAQTYDKENACEPPHLKTGKISGKEAKMEHSILGVAEEDLEEGRLVEAKRKMKQKGGAYTVIESVFGGGTGGRLINSIFFYLASFSMAVMQVNHTGTPSKEQERSVYA
jgi:hypothetical protein